MRYAHIAIIYAICCLGCFYSHAQASEVRLELKGIVLLDRADQLIDSEKLAGVVGLEARGVDVPGTIEELSKRLAPLYLAIPISEIKLDLIKETIYRYYEEQKHPFILVVIPPQVISTNVLQILILKARIGEIKVEGNKWFSDAIFYQYIDTKKGEELDPEALEKDLQFINRNPFRKAQIIFAPGEKTGYTDVILAVKDRFPLRIYAGADNTGIRTTGRERFFTGFTEGKLFDLDQLFSFQFTSSYDVSKFVAYTGQYIVLLPWKHIFNLYGGYSKVRLPHSLGFQSKGESSQGSGRYTVPVQFSVHTLDEFTIGFDFKRMNNTLEFSDLFINASQAVNLSQFIFGYKRQFEGNSYRLSLDTDLYWSPAVFFSHQTDTDFSALRPGAKNRWVYAKAMVLYLQELMKGFSLQLCTQGQLSSQNLLPSEEFGIGGYDTVRGYDERQLNAETAFLSSLQFNTPSFPLFFRGKQKDALHFLVFADYGYGKNHNALPMEPIANYLLGVGPGFRYLFDRWITARFDLGFKLHKAAEFTGGNIMIHFSAICSY